MWIKYYIKKKETKGTERIQSGIKKSKIAMRRENPLIGQVEIRVKE